MDYRSGEKLWQKLEFQTGKRIKGHWRDVPKMVHLLTLANHRKSLGMNTSEIDRLAQYLHEINMAGISTQEVNEGTSEQVLL